MQADKKRRTGEDSAAMHSASGWEASAEGRAAKSSNKSKQPRSSGKRSGADQPGSARKSNSKVPNGDN